MRVLHAASSYPLDRESSTAPFMGETLSALATRGINVTAVVPRIRGLVEGHRSGVDVVGAPYAPRKLQVWGYGRSLDARNRLRPSALAVAPSALSSMGLTLRQQIRRNRPDVVHLHWVLPQGLLTAAVPKDIPVVVSAHGADARFARGGLGPLARRILQRADAVVAASSQILDLLEEVEPSIKEKSQVIPHGAASDVFNPMSKGDARVSLGIDQQTRLVLAVGRLVSKKGFAHLIRSMGFLSDLDALLYIVGDGPERTILQRAVQQEQHDKAQLVGAQPRELVAKWMAASDVVVVPGVSDGHDVDSGPVVLMEALAMGRPVVASHVGMAPDLIEDDVNGYLLSSTSPESIASAVRDAILDTTRLGEGARKTFLAVGGWDRVARQLETLYVSLLTAKGTPT